MTDTPDQDAFDKLLRWLDPDRDKAAQKYEKILNRLIKIFAAKGCWVAEDLADQTINVVTSKIDWLLENFEGDPALYFYGVGKKVFLEWLKKLRRPDIPRPDPLPPSPPDPSQTERLSRCLDQCLLELSPDDRSVVRRYHEGEKGERIENRKQLASELGISQNALRIKVWHIHTRLRRLMEQWLKRFPED